MERIEKYRITTTTADGAEVTFALAESLKDAQEALDAISTGTIYAITRNSSKIIKEK